MIRPELSHVKAVPFRALTPNEHDFLRAHFSTSNSAQADLTTPVYVLTGKVYTQLALGGAPGVWTSLCDFKIGKWEFSHDRISPAAVPAVQQVQDGQLVRVEFSPQTKVVWSLASQSVST